MCSVYYYFLHFQWGLLKITLVFQFSGDLQNSTVMTIWNWGQRSELCQMGRMPRFVSNVIWFCRISVTCTLCLRGVNEILIQCIQPIDQCFFLFQLLGCHGPLSEREPGRAFLTASLRWFMTRKVVGYCLFSLGEPVFVSITVWTLNRCCNTCFDPTNNNMYN